MLRIYNTLTRQKTEFKPIQPGKVSMYVCGMTVYDYCHIGHARVMVVFDMVARYFRARGLDLRYVRNITDIEDKIIQRAQANQESWQQLTQRFIQAMDEDAAALLVIPPDEQPKATDAIPAMLSMIERLIAKGYAYQADNGDVYYSVERFENYGALSGKQLEDLQSGARVDVDESKRSPLDFVLWKSAKPGEPSWSSPWGEGRPGWHIECSAMSTECLGNHFDLHGGGLDLTFPHHENEIAQSEAATGQKYVNYWMHNGFVQVDDEKMSKSLGNFFTIREVLAHYPGEVVRYFILNSHYRRPLNYSHDNLQQASNGLQRLYTALRDSEPAAELSSLVDEYQARFLAAMEDDFNTPEAIAVLFELAHNIHRFKEQEPAAAAQYAAALKSFAAELGLLQADAETFLKGGAQDTQADAEIDALVAQRDQARADKDWAAADMLRKQLDERGVVIEDTPKGGRWRYR